MKEEENNPFSTKKSSPQKEREDLLKKIKQPTSGRRSSCCARTKPFFKVYLEQFDATLLLLPYLFIQVGYASATVQIVAFSILSAFCAKLMVESARLQVGNFHMHNREDFESLVSSNRVNQNWLVGTTYSIYPFLLVAGTGISIILTSSLIDEIINVFVEEEAGLSSGKQYFVSLLPASDKEMKPIPDTELIQMSRGYAFCLVIALLYSAMIGPRKLLYSSLWKVLALMALFAGTCLEFPEQFWANIAHAIANRQFSDIQVPTGENITIIQSIFYSGFVAFTVSNLPIVAPEISSELKTGDLPIYRATFFAIITKLAFGMLGASLILGSKLEELHQFALVGAGLYALFLILPSIIQVQAKV